MQVENTAQLRLGSNDARYQRATIYSLQINVLGGSQTSKKYSTCRPGLLWKSRRIHLHAQITMTQILLKEVQTNTLRL